MKIDLFYELAKLFKENNFSLYLVGGSVRDYLLYDEFDDMDVVTDAKMQDLKSFLNFKSIFENVGSGVIIYKGHEIDITTLRKEDNYLDYRHPDLIEYVNTPLEEYKRRDLTINALYLDIDGKILDYTTGKEDLDNRIIKIIGNPQIRFNEDPLRILRCLRFSFNLKFELDKKLEEAIFLQKHLLKKLNYQKITSELLKFKCSPDEVRLFLSKYRIDEVIPLYFENTKKQIFDLHCDTITKLYDEKQNFVKKLFSIRFK